MNLVGKLSTSGIAKRPALVGTGLDWRWFARALLPAWFAAISALVVWRFGGQSLGLDATNYLGATRAWLAGGDPWAGTFGGLAFAAPPPSLLAALPFALLPDPLGWWAMMLAGPILAIAGIRLLRLPWWWLAFPPLVVSAYLGNPAAWIPALMFVPPLAVLAKAYAVVPLVLLGRWRALAATAVVLVVTFPILPWVTFAADWPLVSANLVSQSGGGFGGPLLLSVIVLAVLHLRDRERGAWLAVPMVWPSSQWGYATIAMPAGIVCAILAVPVAGAPLVAGLAVLAATIASGRTT